jgi:hypothetical protein
VVSTLLWLAAISLEIAALARAVERRLLRRYKLFYFYLGVVLVRDLSLLCIYFLWPRFYSGAYWGSELLGIVAGCALVWEVYKLALARYAGALRVAHSLLLFVFIITFTRILVQVWNSSSWTPGATTLQTELDVRVVQAAMLLGLIALFAYYSIPLGRNLKGIVYGYGFFLVTSVIDLQLRDSLGPTFQRLWEYVQPACYLVVLGIWCFALWSYAPVPEETEPRLEEHYQALRTRTRAGLSSARARIARGILP